MPAGLSDIPVLEYDLFYELVTNMLVDERYHCLSYFCHRSGESMKFICCIADDGSGAIRIIGHEKKDDGAPLRSLTASCHAMHIFEREIHEASGINFDGHPWLKPVRYPFDRVDSLSMMDNYPFYQIEGEELHEVGVGPIHAGVIEPGHFRFICNGEKVLHLEIQLGYQHRGLEKLIREAGDGLRRSLLAEDIAGDTAVGHSLAQAQLIESLAGFEPSLSLQAERCIALELERIAVHIGDTAALCGDVAYQLGQVACEALRTLIINTTQFWCGNRFGKGLVRPGGTNYPLTGEITGEILKVLEEVDRRFSNVVDCVYSLPSVLGRFEDIGTVTRQQAVSIGAVGMAARSCGVPRDIRATHPFQYFRKITVAPVMQETGDVLARGLLRALEVKESVKVIRQLISGREDSGEKSGRPQYDLKLRPGRLAVSLVEGWRGEICHVALTDSEGRLTRYMVKDPSVHNWMALALAVRNQEISDFPVCNKSFNLSYCGHDL
ncbi:NADH dehydrogenase subunit [bacterium]|nr:NADH dehydrogenase subunit [bacterium]